MRPRILVIQHHPASPAGIVGARMAARAAQVTTLDAQHGIDLPDDADAHDGLLILGGAMNAYDDARCRHFPALLELARRYAAALQRQTTDPTVPSWAKQMEIFILEDMNELEAARIMLGGLLATGRVRDPEERRFLQSKLDELERRLKAPQGPAR